MKNNANGTVKFCPLLAPLSISSNAASCVCMGERCGFWMAATENPCCNTAPAGECAVLMIAGALTDISTK